MADTDTDQRLSRARQAAADAGIDALLIGPGPDLRWLTGYSAKARERLTCLVLPAAGSAIEPFLVVPGLELGAARTQGADRLGLDLATWEETQSPYDLIAGRVGNLHRVAVADTMRADHVLLLRSALPSAQQSLASAVLRDLRMRKSAAEVEALRRAGAAIDRVHRRMGEFLRVGRTERDAGRALAAAILEEGHATVEFINVGSGPNGASPHHTVGDRVLQAGDPVVVDIGGTTPEGYCSDSTRTYVVGAEPEQEFGDYYAVLQQAQEAAVRHARAGVTAASVDAAARDLITAAGYGERFIHRTGHGIGVEVHEDPYIVAGNDLLLGPGMAFSIEPGIYLEGRSGARIEDIVVVTDGEANGYGVERLNVTDRTYQVLPG